MSPGALDNPLFDVDDTLTVGQLNRRVGESVRRSFSGDVWVQGQIRNLSRSGRGHVYFTLCDPSPAGSQPKASISVTLFDSNRQIVNRILKRSGNSVRMDDGVEVRIKATVDFYSARGQLQLNMTSIDPEFTLGRLGADRDQLLRNLEAQDLLGANGRVPLPLVPLRVGLITSSGSAAHADFEQQLIASGYAFSITVLSTRVQGEFAPDEIAVMVSRAARLDVDVLAIVRGGGARTDLAAFDTEPVARAIAASTKPVVSGIGHEVDSSVADLVAHAALKTPTACAQFLIERVAAFERSLTERADRLTSFARATPLVQRSRIDDRADRVAASVGRTLDDALHSATTAANALDRRVVRILARHDHELIRRRQNVLDRATKALAEGLRHCDHRAAQLHQRPSRVLRDQRSRIDLLEARVSAVDPMQALRRGYSITTTATGRLVRSADQLSIGDTITTRLAAGTVASTVVAIADIARPADPATRDEAPTTDMTSET